jgi:hypothetical protein
VRDEFGNPVPSGVAVSFQTDFGAVGTATSGGCSTDDTGKCAVPFRVQEPRGTGRATVTATIKKGDGTEIVKALFINMSEGPFKAEKGGSLLSSIAVSSSCVVQERVLVSDALGRSPPAGLTVSASELPTGLAVNFNGGTPVLDVLNPAFPPVEVAFEVNTSGLGCKSTAADNTAQDSRQFKLLFRTPSGLVNTQLVTVNFVKAP